ncbi:MAG: hypothetical protein ACTSPS_17555 [Promethearchaeota archaeon]
MAVAKSKNIVKPDEINVPIPIRFFCPICKTSKKLKIAKSVINQSGQLTTISIPKNKVCEHHFQAFVDKNFVVRGYQRVDFEIGDDKIEDKKDPFTSLKDNKLFDEIHFQGNHLEYNPQETQTENMEDQNKKEETLEKEKPQQLKQEEQRNEPPKRKEMTLEEIYDEFWEFIDENNHEFREFIVKDPRRGKIV